IRRPPISALFPDTTLFRSSRRLPSGGGVRPPRRSVPHPLRLLGGELEAARHGSESADELAARVPPEGNHRTEPAEYPAGRDWPHPRVVQTGAEGPRPGYPEDERQHRAAPDAGAQLRRARGTGGRGAGAGGRTE